MIGGAFSWDGRAAYLARWDGKNFHKLAVHLVEPYYDSPVSYRICVSIRLLT